jgi:hypothetical protein
MQKRIAIAGHGFFLKFGLPGFLRQAFSMRFTWEFVSTSDEPYLSENPKNFAHRDTVATEQPISFAACVAVFIMPQV